MKYCITCTLKMLHIILEITTTVRMRGEKLCLGVVLSDASVLIRGFRPSCRRTGANPLQWYSLVLALDAVAT